MKKVLAMLLTLALVFGFAGCGNETSSTPSNLDYEIGDTGNLKVPFGDGEKIRFVGVSSTLTDSRYVFEKLSEITGLNVELELLPSSSYMDKIKVILASKNIPEIIGDGFDGFAEVNDFAMQGAFAAVDDYIDEMPNFKSIFGEGQRENWVFKSYTAADGKLYGLPVYDTSRTINHGMLYRKDIFDKYGIEMWNSPESFYQVLKTLKEKDPDCVPFASKNKEDLIYSISSQWNIKAFEPYFDEKTKQWKYSDTDPQMKDMLDFLRKLYDEKLIDPEFLTRTQADWTSMMTQNKSYVTYDWIGRMDMFDEQSEIEGYDLRYANPMGPNQKLNSLSKVSAAFSTVAKNDKSELSMKLMDFLYSPAGAELMTLGIKGETYELTEDGKVKYIGFEDGKKVEITDLEEKYGMFMQGTYRRMDKRSCYFNYTEKEQEAQDWINKVDAPENIDPILSFLPEDQEVINDLTTKLTTQFKEMLFGYLVGNANQTGDKVWNDWLAKAKKLGEDELVKIYNDTYKRMGY